ncbi:MAG TPA: hypothetical protein VMN79_16035 [Casimicrobiaceae bacterium]|nr:hypothetical protein [Casimicrobiaceae bacterium]
MPITMRTPPRGGAARLVGHLTELARERTLPQRMREMRLETLSHSEPHPVYFVPLDALAEGKLLAAAKQTSWRYLIVQDNDAVAEAELTVGRRGAKSAAARPLAFAGLTHGPFAAATVDALHAAERLPQVARDDYELRLLRIPAVYFVALWLHGAKEDLLIPMGNPPGGLKSNHPYSEAAIVRALRGPAEQAVAFEDAYQQQKRKRFRKKT